MATNRAIEHLNEIDAADLTRYKYDLENYNVYSTFEGDSYTIKLCINLFGQFMVILDEHLIQTISISNDAKIAFNKYEETIKRLEKLK